MKRFALLIVLGQVLTGYGQTPFNDPHWNLLWQDDFNTIDITKWNVRNNFDHYGGEGQVYTNRPANVFISSGSLVLHAQPETYSCPPPYVNCNDCCRQANTGLSYSYTSGMVETMPAYYPQYGYLEARIKVSYYTDLFPAFWTFSGIAGYQEIDIFEMIPGYEEYCNYPSGGHFFHTSSNVMTSNIHLAPPTDPCPNAYNAPSTMLIQDYTQWHTYAIEWSPSKIIWYVDDYPVKFYLNNSLINAPTSIILNLALKPSYTGPAADMMIDFVKVYELNKDCNDFINTSNYDFTTYNNVEKDFIKIGEGGGVNAVPAGEDVTIRASQFIEITGDFTVPEGSGIYADANDLCDTDLSTNCSLTFNPCTYNFTSYDNSVKRNILLGNGGCNVTITPGSTDILLQATDAIDLGPGVTIVPTASNIVDLMIVPCP